MDGLDLLITVIIIACVLHTGLILYQDHRCSSLGDGFNVDIYAGDSVQPGYMKCVRDIYSEDHIKVGTEYGIVKKWGD